jgi:plasmid stabilization system protein ParE
MSQANDDDAPSYVIRILPHAERDIEAHLVYIADMVGAEVGRAWYDGLRDAIALLSQNPRRHSVISENQRFRREVRQFLYRRTTQGAAWRVLFTVQEEAEDAPTVSILHVRYATQKPITRIEARQIEFTAFHTI